jgi:ABC-type Fe3+/spermidine/putrescine transport system ATPase subunit
MNGGRIEQIGSPEDLYDRPQTRFAAEFIGEASLLEGRVVESSGADLVVEVGPLRIPARAVGATMEVGAAAILMTRPERIEITVASDSSAAAMRVAKRVFQGDRILFELSSEGGHRFQCSTPSVETFRAIQTGSTVAARFRECRAIPVPAT